MEMGVLSTLQLDKMSVSTEMLTCLYREPVEGWVFSSTWIFDREDQLRQD